MYILISELIFVDSNSLEHTYQLTIAKPFEHNLIKTRDPASFRSNEEVLCHFLSSSGSFFLLNLCKYCGFRSSSLLNECPRIHNFLKQTWVGKNISDSRVSTNIYQCGAFYRAFPLQLFQ